MISTTHIVSADGRCRHHIETKAERVPAMNTRTALLNNPLVKIQEPNTDGYEHKHGYKHEHERDREREHKHEHKHEHEHD